MPPNHKLRCIEKNPECIYFKPAGIPKRELEEVILSLDEWEAIRLSDYEGLYQEDAAQKMNVSRQTFGLIIERARKKIADTIINGKSLAIHGGNITLNKKEAK